MKNIKAVHIISKIFHILSIICTVVLITAIIFVSAISVFLISLQEDTIEFSAQGNIGAVIRFSNIISNPMGFIENMDDTKHLDKGSDGEVCYQAKDGTLSGYVKGYEKYNQGTGTFNITSEGVFTGTGGSQKYFFNGRQLGMILLPSILSIMFLLVATFYGRKIFKELKKCTTPFTDTIRKNLLKLSAVVLGYSFIPAIISSLFIFCTGLCGIEKAGINFGYSDISVSNIVMAVVLFALSLVFSYGVSLQQQADETL